MRQLGSFVAVFSLVLFSCDNNTDDQNQSATRVREVENRAINGHQWRVTNYSEVNVDHTATFAGYIFEFDSNNLLTTTNGSENFSGSWSVTNYDKEDIRSEFDDLVFNLNFTNPPVFEDLNEDWEILSMTESKIELRYTRGANNLSDLLTFEKI
jgi:hypothetical protein